MGEQKKPSTNLASIPQPLSDPHGTFELGHRDDAPYLVVILKSCGECDTWVNSGVRSGAHNGVEPGGGDECAVGVEGDRVEGSRVPLLEQELRACLNVPQPPRGVKGGGANIPAARVEGDAREPPYMPCELAQRLTALERPELGRRVAARRYQIERGALSTAEW